MEIVAISAFFALERAADAHVEADQAETLHHAAGYALRQPFLEQESDCAAEQYGGRVDDGSKHGEVLSQFVKDVMMQQSGI